MLGNPSMFTQITERTRGGFDSLLNLINQEAALFQQNRELAKRQSATLQLEQAKAEIDLRKGIALETTKAEIAAHKPLSRESAIRLEVENQNTLMKDLLENDYLKMRFGFDQIVSKLTDGPQGTPMFVNYGVFLDPETGERKFAPIDTDNLRRRASVFRMAEKAENEISSVVRAGLGPVNIVVNNQEYAGSIELENVLSKLRSNDFKTVVEGVDDYERLRPRVPNTELVRSGGQNISESQRQEISKFQLSRGDFVSAYESAAPFLQQSFENSPALGPEAFANMSIAMISQKLQDRLTAYLLKYDGKEGKLLENKDAEAYLAVKRYNDALRGVMSTYPSLPGARRLSFSELYLNPQGNPSDPTDMFVPQSGLTRSPFPSVNTSYNVTNAFSATARNTVTSLSN